MTKKGYWVERVDASEELYLDFGVATIEDVPALLDEYVLYFNTLCPAATLGNKSPIQFKSDLDF